MHTRVLAKVFPDLYQKFLPPFFNALVPIETSAACDDCSMLSETDQAGDKNTVCFSSASKCCTHYPSLPNYLVGSILCTQDAEHHEARKRLTDAVARGVAVTPHGLEPPKKYLLLAKSSGGLFFGHSSGMICPFFHGDRGNCLLWPHLSAVCRTWFCKYDRGRDGMRFWLSLKNYWQYLEKVLSVYVLHRLDFSPDQILRPNASQAPLTAEEIDDRPPHPKHYQAVWGEWSGRESEFYQKAFALVADLDGPGFKKLIGITHDVLLDDVRRRYDDMMRTAPPDKLKRNTRAILSRAKSGNYRAVGYSVFDTVELTPRIYEALDYYDGLMSNDRVSEHLCADGKATPDEALLLSLYRMRILVAHDE